MPSLLSLPDYARVCVLPHRAVVSDMIGAREGLGLILVRFQAGFDIAFMYAVIFVMAMLGLVLFLAISFIDRRVIFWRDTHQGIL